MIQKFCINAVNRMLEEGRTTITAARRRGRRRRRSCSRVEDEERPPAERGRGVLAGAGTCERLGASPMRNPFIAGSWVRGDNFFGRADILREILEGERALRSGWWARAGWARPAC